MTTVMVAHTRQEACGLVAAAPALIVTIVVLDVTTGALDHRTKPGEDLLLYGRLDMPFARFPVLRGARKAWSGSCALSPGTLEPPWARMSP